TCTAGGDDGRDEAAAELIAQEPLPRRGCAGVVARGPLVEGNNFVRLALLPPVAAPRFGGVTGDFAEAGAEFIHGRTKSLKSAPTLSGISSVTSRPAAR